MAEIRIDQLPAAASAQSDHVFPAMRAGNAFGITLSQVRALFESNFSALGHTHSEYAAISHTHSQYMEKSQNLSDLTNAGTARNNIGLGNVNNTSDMNKPVSTAQQAAIDAALAGAGGLTLINSVVLGSNASNVTFSGLPVSTYDHWLLTFNRVRPATNNVDLTMLAGTSPTSFVTTGSYWWARQQTITTGATSATSGALGATGSVSIGLANSVGSSYQVHGHIWFNTKDSFNITHQVGWLSNVPHITVANGVGYLANSGINAIRLLFTSGNIVSGATLRLYGYNK